MEWTRKEGWTGSDIFIKLAGNEAVGLIIDSKKGDI
jgi:hypothetical protein